jgi:hypothetical protein
LTYDSLAEPDRRLLDSTLLQATVVVPKGKDLEPVYRVFERINSSGIKLTPQEIRVALYSGKMVRLIRDMNSDPHWRRMFGPSHSRLKDHELILRYLALLENAEVMNDFEWDRADARADEEAREVLYKPAMTSYLNKYLQRHRNLEGVDEIQLRAEFEKVVSILDEAKGRDALRLYSSQINAAQSDAIMVGVALALRSGALVTASSAMASIDALTGSGGFRSSLLDSTSHFDNVQKRLELAYKQFMADA